MRISDTLGGMCRQVTCKKCNKPSWAGCGAHVEQVLGHAQLGPVVQELLRTGNVTLTKPASTDPWSEPTEEPAKRASGGAN